MKTAIVFGGAAALGLIGGWFGYNRFVRKPVVHEKLVAVMKERGKQYAAEVAENTKLDNAPTFDEEVAKPTETSDARIQLVSVASTEPRVRDYQVGSVEEAFYRYWEELADGNHFIDFDPNWGGAGRGYKGLLHSNPIPGVRCTKNLQGDRLIFTAIKGGVVVVYEQNGEIRWNSSPSLEVVWEYAQLKSAEDINLFKINQFLK